MAERKNTIVQLKKLVCLNSQQNYRIRGVGFLPFMSCGLDFIPGPVLTLKNNKRTLLEKARCWFSSQGSAVMALPVVTRRAPLSSSEPTRLSHEDALEPEVLTPCILQVRLDLKKDGAADFTVHFCGVSLPGLLGQKQSSLVLDTVSIFSEGWYFVVVDTPLPEIRQWLDVEKHQTGSL